MNDFEFNKELEEMKAKKKAEKMVKKIMMETLLESGMPEAEKMYVRVLNKANEVADAIDELIVLKYCTPGNKANIETLNTVLEYLSLVELGIKQFAETTPFVKHEEEGQC